MAKTTTIPLFNRIKAGSRVTILVRNGKRWDRETGKVVTEYAERTGRAVIPSPGHWALNMGGPHGTPGVACPDNVVAVNGKRS